MPSKLLNITDHMVQETEKALHLKKKKTAI
jgi:Arc/MetJ family transcription regulator